MKLFIFNLLFFSGSITFACDVCGAGFSVLGVNGASMGNRNAVGIHSNLRYTQTTHPGIFNLPDVHLQELYVRTELTGLYKLSKKWQLKAIIPYQITEVSGDEQFKINGLSDVTLAGNYFIKQTNDTLKNRGIFWNIGGGIKLPTGAFLNSTEPNYYYYPGTGSWDGLINHVVGIRLGKWILTNENGGIIRSKNKYITQFGAQFSEQFSVFRTFGKFNLASSSSFYWIQGDKSSSTIAVRNSNGTIFQTGVTAVYRTSKWMIQGQVMLPITQHLADGYTAQKVMTSIQFIKYFKK